MFTYASLTFKLYSSSRHIPRFCFNQFSSATILFPNLQARQKCFSPINSTSPLLVIKKYSSETFESKNKIDSDKNLKEKHESLVQRFKSAYKIYGKALIVVHIATSVFWISIFYLIASTGIDVGTILEKLSAPDSIVRKFKVPDNSNSLTSTSTTWIIAYLFYKLATPLRYPVSIYLTRYLVQQLRVRGHIEQIPQQDKLRNLAREGYNLHSKRIKNSMILKRRNAVLRAKQYLSRRSPFRRRGDS